ncbi:hypothetical protein [Azospirillum doebereinerae]
MVAASDAPSAPDAGHTGTPRGVKKRGVGKTVARRKLRNLRWHPSNPFAFQSSRSP